MLSLHHNLHKLSGKPNKLAAAALQTLHGARVLCLDEVCSPPQPHPQHWHASAVAAQHYRPPALHWQLTFALQLEVSDVADASLLRCFAAFHLHIISTFPIVFRFHFISSLSTSSPATLPPCVVKQTHITSLLLQTSIPRSARLRCHASGDIQLSTRRPVPCWTEPRGTC
jgi:hypothetical protein